MELQNEAEKMPANQQEGESRPDVPEASPEAKRAKQLEQVERALRDLAPHMEKFKDADKSALETHAHEQIAALEAELGEKLGQESVDLIHKNLVTEVLVRKESLQSTTEGLKEEKKVLEGTAEKKLGPEEQKFNWRINQFSSGLLNGEIPQFFKKFIESKPSEQSYEAAAKRLNALNKEFLADERIGEEKAKAFTERLRTLASELNAQAKMKSESTENLKAESLVMAEVKDVDLTTEEQAQHTEEAGAEVETPMDGVVAPLPETFDAKPIETAYEDESEETAANNAGHFEDEGDTTSEVTVADRAEAMEDINESKVEETIINLVKAPETILSSEQADQKVPAEEKAVKVLLEALGSRYNDPEVLVKRLMDVFVGYKVAWVHDRRVRPGLSEGAHKKMALEDTIKDIPVEESQLIEHLLQGDPQTTKGLTKGIVMKDYIGLIERKSHLASPEVDSEDGGAEAEAA